MTNNQEPRYKQIPITNNQSPNTDDVWLLKFGYWSLFGYCFLVIGYLTFFICDPVFAQDFIYNSRGKRDPFVPLVGPGAAYQVKEAVDINSIEDVALEGIVYDEKGDSRAIINGMILKEGDQAGVVVVDKIEPKKVILVIEDNRYEIMLGGEKGGEGK